MATIDKPLPNVSETVVEVPKKEELIQERDEIIEKKNILVGIKTLDITDNILKIFNEETKNLTN